MLKNDGWNVLQHDWLLPAVVWLAAQQPDGHLATMMARTKGVPVLGFHDHEMSWVFSCFFTERFLGRNPVKTHHLDGESANLSYKYGLLAKQRWNLRASWIMIHKDCQYCMVTTLTHHYPMMIKHWPSVSTIDQWLVGSITHCHWWSMLVIHCDGSWGSWDSGACAGQNLLWAFHQPFNQHQLTFTVIHVL